MNRFIFDSYTCVPALPRPNTCPQFRTADISGGLLINSLSPLILHAWQEGLRGYPGNLSKIIEDIIRCGCLLGYQGPDQHILSENLPTANNDPLMMERKIVEDLSCRRIAITDTSPPFISSPLGFAPKPDRSWC